MSTTSSFSPILGCADETTTTTTRSGSSNSNLSSPSPPSSSSSSEESAFTSNEQHHDHTRNAVLTSTAQKLNNQGSYLINTRQYDRAITLLTKALNISQNALQLDTADITTPTMTMTDSSSSSSGCCNYRCYHITLDECMSLSSLSEEEEDEEESSSRIQQQDSNTSSSSSFYFDNDGDDDSDSCYYIYTKPIYVPENITGITLSLIIMFNLALALQLSAFNELENNKNYSLQESLSSFNIHEKLQKSSKLYEIAYQLQSQQQQQQPSSSLRFSIVVANNLGQIHRLFTSSKDAKQHQHQQYYYTNCMQYVMTMIIYMIDYQSKSSSFVVFESSTTSFFEEEIVGCILSNATRCLTFSKNICANAA